MARLIWGSDLYKGFKLDKNHLMFGTGVDDFTPFQMLSMEEKTIDWIKAVADFYETAGWNNVERKAGRIQKNYWMRYGKLDPNDYIINPEVNQFSNAIGMILPEEQQSPLEQFYPLAPNFVDVMRGEFIKRDNRWTIETVDAYSDEEMFNEKQSQFKDVLMQMAIQEKQQTMASMGLTEESDPKQYGMEMEKSMQQLTQVEMTSRGYRTTGAKWAEKVLNIHEKRYNLAELEPDGFESGLITDSEFWHIDLQEDDFKLQLLNPKWCDYHKAPNQKYVSQGDYFLWFDFMSSGDIINQLGRRMKEDDILKLKDIFVRTANMLVPDYLKGRQDAYYDYNKTWDQATDLNPVRNDTLLGKELAYNYMRTPNFDHNMEVDLFDPVYGRAITGHPQMFRVMRLYWRSLYKVGWLTKVNRDGSREQPDWVDENYKITIEPVYDTSVVKEKTKDNLIYGEHIDWTWAPQWRHVIKISPNQKHTFWIDSQTDMSSIYIDGAPVKFQFKGIDNPFDSLPPIEGCIFSNINSNGHSFIDRIKPIQIIYNIAMNKVPKKILEDKGMKIAIDKRSYSTNNPSNTTNGMTPREEYESRLDDSQLLEYHYTRESLEGMGQPALPTVLNMSTVQEAQFYFGLAREIKWEGGELIGITRQKAAGQKASDTAYSIQQAISYSDTQTEKYYEQHANLMERVRQRMLDATQYYSTFHDSTKKTYMNNRDETLFLAIEGMENLLPQYNIYLTSRANVRSALQTISQFLLNENTLPIKPSAKLEAIISNSIPDIMAKVRKAESEQEMKEAEQFEKEMQQRQQQSEIQQAMQEQKLAYDADQKEKDRENQITVAEIRALGGVQTDADKSGTIDAAENLDAHFKQQELNQNRQAKTDETNIKRQQEINKMVLGREKLQQEIEKEKIKQKGLLAVAKENKPPKGKSS